MIRTTHKFSWADSRHPGMNLKGSACARKRYLTGTHLIKRFRMSAPCSILDSVCPRSLHYSASNHTYFKHCPYQCPCASSVLMKCSLVVTLRLPRLGSGVVVDERRIFGSAGRCRIDVTIVWRANWSSSTRVDCSSRSVNARYLVPFSLTCTTFSKGDRNIALPDFVIAV